MEKNLSVKVSIENFEKISKFCGKLKEFSSKQAYIHHLILNDLNKRESKNIVENNQNNRRTLSKPIITETKEDNWV
ncbi:MAG: hypothetical protein U9Q30_03820 [Campylobacterota bacterium]|nr:hypothetical protein [Campylobacterota bacterium]